MLTYTNQVSLELLYDSVSNSVQVVLHVFDELGAPIITFSSHAKSSTIAPGSSVTNLEVVQSAKEAGGSPEDICTDNSEIVVTNGEAASPSGENCAPQKPATKFPDLRVEGRGELLRTVARLLQQLADRGAFSEKNTNTLEHKDAVTHSEPWVDSDVERLLSLELEVIRLQQALQVLQVEFEARPGMVGALEARLQETQQEVKVSQERACRLAEAVEQLQNQALEAQALKAAMQQQLEKAQDRLLELDAERARKERGASYQQQQARQQLSHLKKENQQLKAQISAACGNLKAMGIPSSQVFSRGVMAHVQLASPPDSPSGAPSSDRSGGSDVAYVDFRPPAAKVRQRPPTVPRLQLSGIGQHAQHAQQGSQQPQAAHGMQPSGVAELDSGASAVEEAPTQASGAVPAAEWPQQRAWHAQHAHQHEDQGQGQGHPAQGLETASATTQAAPGQGPSQPGDAAEVAAPGEVPLAAAPRSVEPCCSAGAAISCEALREPARRSQEAPLVGGLLPSEQLASPRLPTTWHSLVYSGDVPGRYAAPAQRSKASHRHQTAQQQQGGGGGGRPAAGEAPLVLLAPEPDAGQGPQGAAGAQPGVCAGPPAAADAVNPVPGQVAKPGKAQHHAYAQHQQPDAASSVSREGDLIGAWHPPHQRHLPHTRRSYASYSGSCTPAAKPEPRKLERPAPRPQRVTYGQLAGFQEVRAAYQAVVASEEGTEARWAQRLSSRSAVDTTPAKIEPIVQGLVELFAESGVRVPLQHTGPCQYRLGHARMVVRLVNGRLMARSGSSNVDVLSWLAKQPVQQGTAGQRLTPDAG